VLRQLVNLSQVSAVSREAPRCKPRRNNDVCATSIVENRKSLHPSRAPSRNESRLQMFRGTVCQLALLLFGLEDDL